MQKNVCDPFEYEHLIYRSRHDLLQTDIPYAFSKKQLKYFRPLFDAVHTLKMAQDSSVRPQLEKVLCKQLKNTTSLTELKWITLAKEMVGRNIELAVMWIDARPNGWDIMETAPASSNKALLNIVSALIPYFIKTDQNQKLLNLIKSWNTDQKKEMATICDGLHENTEFLVDLFTTFGSPLSIKQETQKLNVSTQIVEIFPEYFFDQVERVLVDLSSSKDMFSSMSNFMPFQYMSVFKPGKEAAQRVLQYVEIFPEDLKDVILEKIKSSPYAQDLWDISPEFKAFIEKRAMQEALKNTEPSKAVARKYRKI